MGLDKGDKTLIQIITGNEKGNKIHIRSNSMGCKWNDMWGDIDLDDNENMVVGPWIK